MKITKSRLAIVLSQLKGFESPKVRHEQYITDPEIAAEVLWIAYMKGDIAGSEIVDAGCGTGILGIGALILEAKYVTFIDIDEEALEILKNNLKYVESEELIEPNSYKIVHSEIKDIDIKAEVTLQNPPFGVKQRKADKVFLEKAVMNTKIIYSFHKSESLNFIKAFCKDNKCDITEAFNFSFPLKQTYSFHRKRIQRIPVTCFRITSKHF